MRWVRLWKHLNTLCASTFILFAKPPQKNLQGSMQTPCNYIYPTCNNARIMERDCKSLSAQLNLELKSQDDELLWDFAALTALCFARDTLYIMLSQTHVHPVAFLESSSQITAFRSEPARPLALKISSCGISWPSPFTPCTLSTWFFLILVRWTFCMFARWTRNPVLSEEWNKRLAEGVVTNLAEVLVPYVTSQMVDFQKCVLANTNF